MDLNFYKVFKGNKEGRGEYGELRFAVGVIEMADAKGDVVAVIGHNSMVGDYILDTITTENGVITIVARDIECVEHTFTFELADGHKKGAKGFTEEIRKGKVPVLVLDANRKKVFKRMKNGIKNLG